MHNKFHLPVINRIILKNCSIFTKEPIVSASFNDGVFCLAGANGLGKSTFLIALNFGITGIIAEPSKKFSSIEKYYSDSIQFSSKFFNGRVTESDRLSSEVTIEFKIADVEYTITRGLFDPKGLRKLEIVENGVVKFTSGNLPQNILHDEYTKQITKDIGLQSFEQFVFLQLFVFTFDERRELLFWNEEVLERCLYLAFGVSPEEARKADNLRKEYEALDSNVRNYKWQATQIRNRIEELESHRKDISTESNIDIIQVFEKLKEYEINLFESVKQIESSENEIKDNELKILEFSAKQSSLKNEYERLFNSYITNNSIFEHHPIITNSINNCKCELCGNEGESVKEAYQKILDSKTCPLCGLQVDQNHSEHDQIFVHLSQIDDDLLKLNTKLEDSYLLKRRLLQELDKGKKINAQLQLEYNAYEKTNRETINRYKFSVATNEMDDVIQKYVAQMQEFIEKKERSSRRRDEKSKELKLLQKQLTKQYASVETKFVPKFRNLAKSFLGLDLDIKLNPRESMSAGISLFLDVNNTPRRQVHQLSESQRFFIDIALRMAIAEFISEIDSKATLFIDTPEGSLDIAYESRAGDMFGEFIEGGNRIIMTANINTSQLLTRLATRCKKSKMQLTRMTEWTNLSQVQVDEQELFEKAYSAIEYSLK